VGPAKALLFRVPRHRGFPLRAGERGEPRLQAAATDDGTLRRERWLWRPDEPTENRWSGTPGCSDVAPSVVIFVVIFCAGGEQTLLRSTDGVTARPALPRRGLVAALPPRGCSAHAEGADSAGALQHFSCVA